MPATTTPRSTTSASNYHRRRRCPGSHWAEHGLPEANSEYAAEGTRLHAALIPDQPAELIPVEPEPAEADLVEKTKALFDEILARTISALAIAPDEPFTEGYERELTARKGIRHIMNGHCDYWRYYPEPKVLVIIDAKFGFIEVTSAPTNLQLRAYAVMGSQEWDVETAVVAIAQPRAYMIEGAESITIARYDRTDLTLALSEMLEDEKAWIAKDAPRAASEDACRYCKAKLLCPAYGARIGNANVDIAGIADLSAEQFTALFTAILLANKEDVQKAVKDEARSRIAEGRLPGWKMKPNAPRRSITDPVAAAKLLRGLGFSDDQLAAASKVSLGEAVSVRRKATGEKEKDAKTVIANALAPVIESTTPAPSIVEETDADKTRLI